MRPAVVACVLFLGIACAGFASAQTGDAVKRVMILGDSSSGATVAITDAIRSSMRDFGWSEGRDFEVEVRFAATPDRWRQIAAEVERLRPDVIVACSPCAFRIAPDGPSPIRGIPIVFVAVSDPVAAKMVASLSRPGGMMTGVAYLGLELNVKRLQLLKEALPKITRVGVIVAKVHPLRDRMIADLERAAPELNVKLAFADSTGPPYEPVFDELAAQDVQALMVLQGPMFNRDRKMLADLALRHRLPLVHEVAQTAEAGALLAYATSTDAMLRLAATYVDRILRGAKPADLPVQQPTTFELVINIKTARTLRLTLPSSLLRRADRLVE